MSPQNLRTKEFMKALPGNCFSYETLVLFDNIDLSKIQILQNLIIIIKYYRLSHDVVTWDVSRNVLTAYC